MREVVMVPLKNLLLTGLLFLMTLGNVTTEVEEKFQVQEATKSTGSAVVAWKDLYFLKSVLDVLMCFKPFEPPTLSKFDAFGTEATPKCLAEMQNEMSEKAGFFINWGIRYITMFFVVYVINQV
ncbi:uncharacterized protein LOC106673963 [Cimex lectularius]|uniref:Uncharacterized protein n=1 Tax=Cimex lectularius TaxID=79782 RepID=A0A8I6S9D8_CIMLE|nr:uncharacterized protein LOC106673963 [Cimex lectularius]XP_014261859.1 uncharacterized protein LOC106673963 [Cimex lectularius]